MTIDDDLDSASSWEPTDWPGYDAVVEVVWRWERYAAARDPFSQAEALIQLANAMSDLSSWAPRCCDAGYLGQDHICEKQPSA